MLKVTQMTHKDSNPGRLQKSPSSRPHPHAVLSPSSSVAMAFPLPTDQLGHNDNEIIATNDKSQGRGSCWHSYNL